MRPVQKVADGPWHYRGYYDEGGVCRVRLFTTGAGRLILALTELPDNTNTSVTNLVEILAAEVLLALAPDYLGRPDAVTVLEHYPPAPRQGLRTRETDSYSRVTFDRWQLGHQVVGGVIRVSLGEPCWEHLGLDEVAALIGPNEISLSPVDAEFKTMPQRTPQWHQLQKVGLS